MPPILIDLRRQILRRPTERIALLTRLDHLLRQPKIRNLQIAIRPHKYILWFEIPVNCILLMKVVQGEDDLAGV